MSIINSYRLTYKVREGNQDKAALLLSSASPNPYAGAIASYKDMCAYMGLEDAGVITAAGDENGSEAKLAEIREFAKAL